MKSLKKIMATVFACALAFSAMPVSAGQATDGLADGTAYLNINKQDWTDFTAEYKNAEITGDGQYTVSMDCADGVVLGEFNALEVVNGEATLGNASTITIDKVEINGEEVKLAGPNFTCSADGGGVTTRANLYNIYNKSAVGDDGSSGDARVASGDIAEATGTIIPADYTYEKDFVVKSLVVTFTVANFGATADYSSGAAADGFDGDVFAHLSFNNADWNDGDMKSDDVLVEGDGDYVIKASWDAPFKFGEFSALEIENGELKFGRGVVVTITSIKADGEEVMEGKSYTCSADGGAVTTRVNVFNQYNDPSEDAAADGSVDCRIADGSVMDGSARIIPEGLECSEMEIAFTVSNCGAAGAEGASAEVAPVDLNGTYHAYLGLQTPTYSFRNAFDEEAYGREAEGGKYFNQITGWDADNNAVTRAGTFEDVEIAGNGTYTVKVTGMDLAGDFDSQDYFNLIFLSTDIPNTGEITISDIVLSVDGMTPEINPILSPDSVNYVNMLIQNIWNDDVKEIGYYNVPPTEMSITFTVSGFAYDNAGEAPAEEAPAEVVEEKSSNKGLIAGIIVVAVAACGGAAFAFSKKKKAN